jgi:NADPH:quinone reductase-like Zn-dependent oxidoreductase
MIKVTRSAVIDVPVDTVWQVLRDFNSHVDWHPAIDRSEIEGGEPPDRIGCVRNFRLRDGNELREQLLALSDRDYISTYCILDATLPMRRYVATLRLKPVTDGNRTFWHWQSTFDVPRGREREFDALVGDGVYVGGFEGLRAWLRRGGRRGGNRAGDSGGLAGTGALPGSGLLASAGNLSSDGHLPGSGYLPGAGDQVTAGALSGQGVVVTAHGDSSRMSLRPVTAAAPGPGQVRIRQVAIGVNYIDVYVRKGLYPMITPPAVIGMEAAGTVVDVGPGVAHLLPGDRVAYACPPPGAYCSIRTMAAGQVVVLPEDVAEETAAAVMLKGMSAQYLLHRVHRVRAGETVLVHAAAGGLGLMLCRWASHLGARVLGTVSTPDKARRARDSGCELPIVTGDYSFAEQVLQATGGRGADVVYDGLGRAAFQENVRAVATCGHWISYGEASGTLDAVPLQTLSSKSITLTRPVLFHYTAERAALQAIAADVFAALRAGVIRTDISARYPLAAAAQAHEDLESRRTSGQLVLLA